jgi:hypothetical protein
MDSFEKKLKTVEQGHIQSILDQSKALQYAAQVIEEEFAERISQAIGTGNRDSLKTLNTQKLERYAEAQRKIVKKFANSAQVAIDEIDQLLLDDRHAGRNAPPLTVDPDKMEYLTSVSDGSR